jgi:hypothetical protein
MSPLERPVPPAGEELHLPGQSIQPFLLAIFIAVALVGVTTAWWISAAGGFGVICVIVAWVRDARQELSDLPVHDESH